MKDKLQQTLGAKVDPLFFAFSCILLILLLISAQVMIRDIARESDNGAEMLRLARLYR